MDIDLDKLEQAANASLQHSKDIGSDWWDEDSLATVASDEDSAFMAAASPQLVLELISRLRAAEENYQAATLRANANAEMLKGLQGDVDCKGDDPRKFVIRGRTIEDWVWGKYKLCGYQPGRISLHHPEPYGGLYFHIEGEIADKLGRIYDSWNYNVYQRRKQRSKTAPESGSQQ